jgi:hypothetical protein
MISKGILEKTHALLEQINLTKKVGFIDTQYSPKEAKPFGQK